MDNAIDFILVEVYPAFSSENHRWTVKEKIACMEDTFVA
jgi:hypothetical protein